MDTMLSLRITILSLLLRLIVTSESSNLVSAKVIHPKVKRDLSGFPFVTVGPPLIRSPNRSNGVISAFAQDDSIALQPITKPILIKNGTKLQDSKIYYDQSQAFTTIFDPSNPNTPLTEVPSVNGRYLTFPSNHVTGKTHPANLYRPSEHSVKLRLNGPAVQSQTPYQKSKLPYDGNRFPIYSNFYIDPLIPFASQPIKKPIYKVHQHQDTKIENNSQRPAYRAMYQAVPNKVVTYPHFPLTRDFTGLDKPLVLTAGTNAKVQAKPLYAFDFPSYIGIPNAGSAGASRVQPNAILQGQYHLPLQSTTGIPQYSYYTGGVSVPSSNDKIMKVAHLEGYQALADQPQLHFGNLDSWRPMTAKSVQFLRPSEKIRTDVEVVDKKKPAPPKPPLPGDDSGEDGNSDDDDENNGGDDDNEDNGSYDYKIG